MARTQFGFVTKERERERATIHTHQGLARKCLEERDGDGVGRLVSGKCQAGAGVVLHVCE